MRKRMWAGLIVGLIGLGLGVHAGYEHIEDQFRGGKSPRVSAIPMAQLTVEPYVVYRDDGGEMWGRLEQWAQIQKQYKRIEVRGFCDSACTFLFKFYLRENICVTSAAWFGFHGPYTVKTIDGQIVGKTMMPEDKYKEVTRMTVPTWLQETLTPMGWSATDPAYAENEPFGLLYVSGDELGLKRCQD